VSSNQKYLCVPALENSQHRNSKTYKLINLKTQIHAKPLCLNKVGIANLKTKELTNSKTQIMKHVALLITACLMLAACNDGKNGQSTKKLRPVDFSHVKITDKLWSPRLDKHAETTLAVCIDQIENQTGRMQNFENAATKTGKHSGIYFDDSDVYKAMEGIAYSLINNPDPALEKKADEWIDKFAAAQEPDGYLNTYYTLTGLDKRWTDMDYHEMYCAGHMLEAAIAYYKATGKRKFLDTSIKMVEHMMSIFGPDKRHWVAGHQEIELALVKLYELTNDKRYLDFSYWLLEERGHGHGSRGGAGTWNAEHFQDVVPVRELTGITGHAVRLMYMLCGMTDVATLKNDTGYVNALNRVWDTVVNKNMYITGGVGSSRHNEGFTTDYDLPNHEAYCETCASVGMVLWNSRMNQMTGDSKYADVMERSLYNGVLAGVSLSGDRFFYVNPLASHGNHHRQAWYGVACCPSQISRFIPSVGNYIYGTSDNDIWVNLFIGNTADIQLKNNTVKLQQETNYPLNGWVSLTILETQDTLTGNIHLRIPAWCRVYRITVNGETIDQPQIENGYAVLSGQWKANDNIQLGMELPLEVVSADPRVQANVGKRAIQYGPLVYCVEEVDNPEYFEEFTLSTENNFTIQPETLLSTDIMMITTISNDKKVTMIPYYAWDNREAGKMKVWIDYVE